MVNKATAWDSSISKTRRSKRSMKTVLIDRDRSVANSSGDFPRVQMVIVS